MFHCLYLRCCAFLSFATVALLCFTSLSCIHMPLLYANAYISLGEQSCSPVSWLPLSRDLSLSPLVLALVYLRTECSKRLVLVFALALALVLVIAISRRVECSTSLSSSFPSLSVAIVAKLVFVSLSASLFTLLRSTFVILSSSSLPSPSSPSAQTSTHTFAPIRHLTAVSLHC